MQEILIDYYYWIKALHVISFIAWMAGLLYLPRLFVYHSETSAGTEISETFKTMERRLLRIIMNPAMISTLVFGILMLIAMPDLLKQGWMHGKLGALFLLFGVHGVLSKHRRLFANDLRPKSAKYYRILNEIPTALMILIVVLAVVKPF
ncbi:MAG: protoporphyrinogen oxidase HemJ [Alphaproteobacteria bacterium]